MDCVIAHETGLVGLALTSFSTSISKTLTKGNPQYSDSVFFVMVLGVGGGGDDRESWAMIANAV